MMPAIFGKSHTLVSGRLATNLHHINAFRAIATIQLHVVKTDDLVIAMRFTVPRWPFAHPFMHSRLCIRLCWMPKAAKAQFISVAKCSQRLCHGNGHANGN